VLNQLVQSTRKSASILTSWPNPSVVGFPVSLTRVFWHSFGPIRSNSDWNRQFLSRYTITSHSLIAPETLTANESDDDHVYAAVGLRQPSRSITATQPSREHVAGDCPSRDCQARALQRHLQRLVLRVARITQHPGLLRDNFFWIPSGSFQSITAAIVSGWRREQRLLRWERP